MKKKKYIYFSYRSKKELEKDMENIDLRIEEILTKQKKLNKIELIGAISFLTTSAIAIVLGVPFLFDISLIPANLIALAMPFLVTGCLGGALLNISANESKMKNNVELTGLEDGMKRYKRELDEIEKENTLDLEKPKKEELDTELIKATDDVLNSYFSEQPEKPKQATDLKLTLK